MSKIKELMDRLNSIKLDKSLLEKINTLKDDSARRKEVIDNALKVIGSKHGLWSITIGISTLIAVSTIPLLLNELNKRKEILNQYKNESNELGIIKNILKQQNIQEIDLKNRIAILNTYLANSSKIIYLPEVIRLSLQKNGIELISFKPIDKEEEELLNADSQENASFDETIDEESIPPVDDFNEMGVDSQETGAASIIEPKILQFKIEARGNYLRALESLKDFQEYKSIILFKEAKFTQEIQESNSGSRSDDGNIMMEFTIAIPTNQSG